MIYIISGTEEEAIKYAKQKCLNKDEWLFIPDSEYSLVWNKTIPSVIFIGTYKTRKDILSRVLEHRDLLLLTIADLEKKIIYDNDGNLVTQEAYNNLSLNLEMVEYVLK